MAEDARAGLPVRFRRQGQPRRNLRAAEFRTKSGAINGLICHGVGKTLC